MRTFDKLLNYLIVFAVLAISGSFFYINELKQRKAIQAQSKTKNLNNPDVDQVVNKYMQQTNQQNEINKIKLEKALLEARQRVISDREIARQKEEKEMQAIPKEKQIWKESDLNTQAAIYETRNKTKIVPKATDEDEVIDVNKLSPSEKKEYAKQYIENARKGGYYLELSDDLQVIKATPIRQPSQQSDSISGSQTD